MLGIMHTIHNGFHSCKTSWASFIGAAVVCVFHMLRNHRDKFSINLFLMRQDRLFDAGGEVFENGFVSRDLLRKHRKVGDASADLKGSSLDVMVKCLQASRCVAGERLCNNGDTSGKCLLPTRCKLFDHRFRELNIPFVRS